TARAESAGAAMTRWTGNPWRRFGLPAAVGWLVVGGYGAAAVVVVASSVWGWSGASPTRPVDEMVSVLCLMFAAACAGYAARSAVGRRRFGWLALGVALLGWTGGQVIWAVYDGTRPVAAEAVLLLYPVGAMVSLTL